MPDKEGEILLHGSYTQLTDQLFMAKSIQQMIKWYTSEALPQGHEKELAPKRRGKILIKLFFSGMTTRQRRKTVEISIRLMGSADSPELITLERIQELSNAIVAKFGNWEHITGKQMFSYSDWDKGYQLQLLANDETEARRIVDQILDIQGHRPEWEYFNLCKNLDEAQRYPDLPNKITVAGKVVRPPQQRAVTTVKFKRALIKFPHIPSAFPLCSPQNNLVKDLNFLENFVDEEPATK